MSAPRAAYSPSKNSLHGPWVPSSVTPYGSAVTPPPGEQELMCRQAAHRTYMDTQLSKGSLIYEPYLLILHASGEQIAVHGFERTDRRATCWAADPCCLDQADSALMISWQNSGRSSGTRPVMMLPSRTAGTSTNSAPAFTKSSRTAT
jgi:hypothetical protein